MLVIKPTLRGKFSLITLGNNTLQIAMPKPIHNVPRKIKKTIVIERRLIPTINVSNPTINAISFDDRLANLGAIGDMIAKAIKGKLVKKATLQLEKPISSRIVPINGPSEVIDGRKLNAIKITPIYRSV